MKLFISLLTAMFFAPSAYAAVSDILPGALPAYDVSGAAPQRMDAAFPEDAPPRAGGSLHGSTFRWERDQNAAWGGGIKGLSQKEGQAGCGPIAAEALVRFFADDPKLDKIAEIFGIAKNKGYWQGQMMGPGAEQKLLEEFGIRTELREISDMNLGTQMIRESMDKGAPVIISTNRHYFFAEGYDNNGRLFVGYTGEVMSKRGGSAQMTLSEISQSGGGGLTLLVPAGAAMR